MTIERTLIIIKPDGVIRRMVGKIIQTFEQAELRVIYINMVHPTTDQVLQHYTDDSLWLETAGSRAIRAMQENGFDCLSFAGVTTPIEVGGLIRQRLVKYMCSGFVVVAVLEGVRAVSKVRQLVGSTLPQQADAGSIRGQYCCDDVITSFVEQRALRNLIHASGSVDEVQREIDIWLDAKLPELSDWPVA
jgi:nucleoside-diphosphate kinase